MGSIAEVCHTHPTHDDTRSPSSCSRPLENLSLCLEPEAACLSVALNKMEPWENETKLMVLDCGGGTIDITTHHVKSSSPLALEELHEPTGGPWGSTMVDAKFKDFIKVIGSQARISRVA